MATEGNRSSSWASLSSAARDSCQSRYTNSIGWLSSTVLRFWDEKDQPSNVHAPMVARSSFRGLRISDAKLKRLIEEATVGRLHRIRAADRFSHGN